MPADSVAPGGVDPNTEARKVLVPEHRVAAPDGAGLERAPGYPDGILSGHGPASEIKQELTGLQSVCFIAHSRQLCKTLNGKQNCHADERCHAKSA